MEPIDINSTHTTPRVSLDKESGKFRIEGVSRPEDVLAFYTPIFNWFNQYLENPNPATTVEFALDYHNSASAKIICKLMNLLDSFHQNGCKICVKWYYHEADDDILEAGEDYKSLVSMPFDIIKI